MAYRVQAGNTVTILHGLVDLAGTGYVTGEAASAWGLSVLNHLRVAQGSITPTITEIGTTGWYSITFTVPAGSSGIWTLDGAEPAGALGSFTYPITVATGLNGSSDKDLTTLARVKGRLLLGDGDTTFDSLIPDLITECSNGMQEYIGRDFNEAAYTEYRNGSGTPELVLWQGPLVSVSSVNEVEYTDAGSGSRGETLTELEEKDRLEYSLRSDGSLARGRIAKIGGVFTLGRKNWKIAYTGGFASLPEGLVGHATDEVVAALKTRDVKGLASLVIADGQTTPLSPKQILDARMRILAPYRY